MAEARGIWARERRFTFLLGTLSLLFLIAPLFQHVSGDALWLRLTIDVLFVVTVLNALWIVDGGQVYRWVVFALAVIAVAAKAVFLFTDEPLASTLQQSFTAVVLAVSLYHVMAHLFGQRDVTAHTLSAAMTVYLLMAVLWALLYSLCLVIDPEAFAFSDRLAEEGARIRMEGRDTGYALYFSIVTLTTLGYGDITPVSALARTLASFEALVGQVFLAVIVARLVGLQTAALTGQTLSNLSNKP